MEYSTPSIAQVEQ